MFYPKVQGPATFRRTRTAFGGYRHELTAAEGDWYDEENMTDRDWPAAAARGPRYAGPDARYGQAVRVHGGASGDLSG